MVIDGGSFGSFAEAMSSLGELTKIESALSIVIKKSKVPSYEVRRFLRASSEMEAMNTSLYQYMKKIFGQIGLGQIDISSVDIFKYNFEVAESPVISLFPGIKGQPTCYITVEALESFFTKDMSLPASVKEVKCRNTGNESCVFEVSLQPLAVYHVALDKVDKGIIGHLAKDKEADPASLAENMGITEEEMAFRIDGLQRYHILEHNRKLSEVGRTFWKYAPASEEEEDIVPPWRDISDITNSIAASESFAEAVKDVTDRSGQEVEEVDEASVINLSDEAKKSVSFAELVSKSMNEKKKEE